MDWWLWFDCDTFFMNMTAPRRISKGHGGHGAFFHHGPSLDTQISYIIMLDIYIYILVLGLSRISLLKSYREAVRVEKV